MIYLLAFNRECNTLIVSCRMYSN